MFMESKFEDKLKFGERLEKSVEQSVKKLGICGRRTNQEFGSEDRVKYGCCDVIVEGSKLVGIECKIVDEPYRKCKSYCGWESEYNVPLNKRSLDRYSGVDFSLWVISLQVFARNILVEQLDSIKKCRMSAEHPSYKSDGEWIVNVDASSWKEFVDIDSAVQYILRSEGIC